METEINQKSKLTKEILEKQLATLQNQMTQLASAIQVIKQLIDKFDWN